MDCPKICRADGCVNPAAMDDLKFCDAHLNALLGEVGQIKIALPSCSVNGCRDKPRSSFSPYCHMHDARIRRHGGHYLKPRPKVIGHSQGYRLIEAKGHPMAKGKYRAFEHRVVYYDQNPDGPEDCHWCGASLTWDTVQVDHLNTVRDDNRPENLVAACGGCNRDRAKPAAARAARERARGFMINGKWLSVTDAARHLGIAPSSIMTRLKNGWSVERAMTEKRGRFGPKRAA